MICPVCKGSGVQYIRDQDTFEEEAEDCEWCGGDGEVPDDSSQA